MLARSAGPFATKRQCQQVDIGRCGDRTYQPKGTNDFHHLVDIVVPWESDHVSLVAAGIWHQLRALISRIQLESAKTYPDAHFDNNAKTALCENTIVVRTKAVVEQLPATISGLLIWPQTLSVASSFVWQSSHSRSDKLAIREDNFHAAVHHPMICRTFSGGSLRQFGSSSDLPPYGVYPTPRSTAFPIIEPPPRSGT
jgi:hypothetical protein